MTSPSRLGPHLWNALPQKWDAAGDDSLVCCGVRDETSDVKSFLFRAEAPKLFRFRPGQFLTLDLEIGGEQINRCYTISSPPTRPDTLSITVKRQPGGKVSNWLHDTMTPGVTISALGPAGDFSCSHFPPAKYLFLSGGSGITPLMSMSRTFYDLGEDADIVFAHSARTPDDIIFRNELDVIAAAQTHFKPVFICGKTVDGPAWTGHTGFLTLAMLRSITRDFAQREIFCCGPAPYMANVRAILAGIGFDMAHYHEESFTFGAEAAGAPAKEFRSVEVATAAAGAIASSLPPASAEQGDATAVYTIEFTKSGRTVECRGNQFILDAAKAAGLRLPSSCTKGLCGTCKSKKLSGTVAMSHQGGIRPREIDQGLILPCCSKPTSDVVLEK